MSTMIYKGDEIETMAEQLDDNAGWSASVRIYAHNASHSAGKVFKLSEIHINQEEAIKYGLIMGQRIIEGVVEDCSIDDL